MKKQYLIGLLSLVAISIPLANSFSTINLLPTNFIKDETPKTNFNTNENIPNIDKYSDEYPNYSIEQIDMGYSSSAAIVNDGTNDHLYTWGRNMKGQLGLGTSGANDSYDGKILIPQEVEELPDGDIEQISMGFDHSAAIINDGKTDHLYTWGDNSYGQLGLGNDAAGQYNTPQELETTFTGDIEQISMGENYSTAIVNDGKNDYLYTWGDNTSGQLGVESIEGDYNTPQKVTGLPKGDIEQISMGDDHSTAIVNSEGNDYLYAWGLNDYGQLGLGNNENYNTPQEVEKLPDGDIEQIATGDNYSAAVISDEGDDKLYTWGRNFYGQLGVGDNKDYNTPQEVTDLPDGDIKEIAMGESHSGAIINNGENDQLYTWGYNWANQLGLGTDFQETKYIIPQLVPDFSNGDIKQISMGDDHSAALTNDGNTDSLYMWGYNDYGQLGFGNYEKVDSPKQLQEMPYINNINSNVIPVDNESQKVKIEYDFKTSFNVQSVDVSIYQTDNKKETIETINTIPTVVEETKYSGEAEFNNISSWTEYTYNIDLNYLTKDDELKTTQIDQDTFIIEGIVESTIEQTQDVLVTSSTEAIIQFDVTPGKDVNGDNVHVMEVKWMNGSQELATSMATSNVMTTNQLVPYNTYNGTTLIATMDDGSIAETNVDEFQANSGEVASTISQDGEVSLNDEETASVNYEVTPGKEKNGKDVEVSNVKWMNGDDQLGVSKSNSNTGSIKANNLKLNENYSNTILVATMSDGTTAMAGIEPFKEAPLIQDPEEVNVDYEHDILEVSGEIDTNGAEIKDIYFVDNNGKEIASEALISEPNITKDNSENVSYDVWTSEYVEEEPSEGEPANLENYSLRVEYETSTGQDAVTTTTSEYSTKAEEQVVEDDLDYLYNGIDNNTNDETKLGGWSIFGIIIASFFMIGFIGYAIYYLFNKNKITKI